MTEQQIFDTFQDWFNSTLGNDFEWLLSHRPLFSHYTSIEVIKSILTEEQIWFSNPLYMNDLQELKYGVELAISLLHDEASAIKEKKSLETYERILYLFMEFYEKFNDEDLLDIYVACFAEHQPENTDGVLSMWRGYGHQGGGAALVFNSSFVSENAGLPIVISKVLYYSPQQREDTLKGLIIEWRNLFLSHNVSEEQERIAVQFLFDSILIQSLTTKHWGFKEECEWRLIYLPDRDQNNILQQHYDYIITSRGVEPKLKMPIKPLPFDDNPTWNLESILDAIILGPTVSSTLATKSFLRMLEKIDRSAFRERVIASTIPLRPVR